MNEPEPRDEFAQLVLSKLDGKPFEPMAQYIPDDDSLEVIVSPETYKPSKAEGDPSVRIYIGRDTDEVVGIRIARISRHVSQPPDAIHFEVSQGLKIKVRHLLERVRAATSRDKQPTLSICIKQFEEMVPEDLELQMCAAGA